MTPFPFDLVHALYTLYTPQARGVDPIICAHLLLHPCVFATAFRLFLLPPPPSFSMCWDAGFNLLPLYLHAVVE